MRIFLAGIPLICGGANRELFDTALLWRRAGIDVSCFCLSHCSCGKPIAHPDCAPLVSRLAEAEVSFVPGGSGKLRGVPGLAGSIVVSFCNQHALHCWPELAKLGCRLVWSPCMTETTLVEAWAFGQHPPTAVHFQSKYQATQTRAEYEAWGCREFAVIHGAFEPLSFRPFARREPFVVGRLSRPHRSKYHPQWWKMLTESGVDLRALCQGWDEGLTRHCGEPPEWATCLPQDTLSTTEFLGQCHALVCCNWSTPENWPRVGLEAMSAGVPLVVDRRGGWSEQCGGAAIYCSTPVEFSAAINHLANDEPFRQEMIERGRRRVAQIADPALLARQWGEVFRSL